MTKIIMSSLPEEPWESPTAGTDLPYDFVPVTLFKGNPADQPQPPVWHDGANSYQKELYSGELRCTLTTLSPLLVANHQVPLSEMTAEFRNKVESSPTVVWNSVIQEKNLEEQLIPRNVRENEWLYRGKLAGINRKFNALNTNIGRKKVLFPLTLGAQGPVLIPGESIKGMFRHAMGALLSSPLERVQEENYSSRPNIDPTGGRKTAPYAARIEEIDLDRHVLKVQLINDIKDLQFVKETTPQKDGTNIPPGDELSADVILKNKFRVKGQRTSWKDGGPEALGAACTYLRYHFALDVERVFMTASDNHAKPHPGVFVPTIKFHSGTTIIDPSVVRQYRETMAHLQDSNEGHLSRVQYKGNNNVVDPELAKNDLIFCECLLENNQPTQVISFGHNFRYRWRHLNTVTRIAIEFDGKNWKHTIRPELTAHPDEKPEYPTPGTKAEQPLRPAALSAVRNLLGYVVTPKKADLHTATPYGELSKLQDPFNRMAGRISFNIAMERIDGSETDEVRFINADKDCLLFMHPASSPKASFSRSYVPGKNHTWGDGIAKFGSEYVLQNGTRHFAGRKFYLHQLSKGGTRLDPSHYDLSVLLEQQNTAPPPKAFTRWELVNYLWSDQSAIAARVSKAGREFGFTVRFKGLRAHELATLAATLSPDTLAQEILAAKPQRLSSTSAHLEANRQKITGSQCYGHKLGHGKAMGMGSVRITVDSCELWSDHEVDLKALIREQLLPKLAKSGQDATVLQWFKVLQLAHHRSVRPYLLHRSDNNIATDIVKWSQDIRKEHLKYSREHGFDPAKP
jgi:CRISPR-associated protein (TIGR03986 family)